MKKRKSKNKPKPQPEIQSPELKSLIEEAYTLFTYPVNGGLTVCKPCCISLEQERELISTPVRELSRALVYDYLDAVHYDEIGYEIKHFLPRILEFLVLLEIETGFGTDVNFIRHSTEITLDKCHFKRPVWSVRELDFMHRFSYEFIKNIPSNDILIDYILMFDLAELPTKHLLELWQEMLPNNFKALEHFEKMMRYEVEGGFYHNAFSENPEFNNQVSDWIKSPNLREVVLESIEKYYFENPNLDEETAYYFDVLYSRFENKTY